MGTLLDLIEKKQSELEIQNEMEQVVEETTEQVVEETTEQVVVEETREQVEEETTEQLSEETTEQVNEETEVKKAKRPKIKLNTQKGCILRHLQEYGTLTSWTAITEYGALRLPSIICDLRKYFKIVSKEHTTKTRYGTTATYVEYIYLGEREDVDMPIYEKFFVESIGE